ncbi:MAG: AAA family ATPase [Gemmatimonadaceae bacterium]|nr:AAA family ATPase [Gemmatimonadaceae bacterium]
MIRSSVVCPVSVGREAPLRELLEHLDRATAGRGTILLLGGNAGVGKSRLLRELKREAATRQVRIIEGRCSSTESSVPYAPFMDALRFRIERGEGEQAAQILGPLRAILAPIFPQLESRADPIIAAQSGKRAGKKADEAPERASDRPVELIFSVLDRLAREEPLILILEDVHWADQTSLELLHHLAHRATQTRLLLIATYRSDELYGTHPLRRLLGALTRDRTGEEMRLGPLSRDQTAEMLRCILDKDPDPAFVAAIWKRSEGNPFFVEELLNTFSGESPIEPNAEAAKALDRARLPENVSEAVLARVRALGSRVLETLSAAAVIGRTFEFDDLCAVLGVSEEYLIEVIEQLVAHQLLREEKGAEGERYSFPHALMQETMYESIISRRRRVLHRHVAAVLEARTLRRTPSRLGQLAYHYRLGGDNERAHEYARHAGDEAVRLHAWDDAVEHYENALASLEHVSDNGERSADLLERLAGVAWRQSRAASGSQYAEEALRLRRSLGHTEEAARLLRRVASLRVSEGDMASAAEALDEALRLVGNRPDSPELGPIYDDLGRLSLAQGDLIRAETLFVHGLSLASRAPQSGEEVLAFVSLAELSVIGGQVTTGVTQLDVALSMLQEARLPFERLTRVYVSAVRTLLLAHDYNRALEWAEAASALCRRQGVVGLDSLFRALRAAALTITGEGEDTLAEASAAVSELRLAGRAELREALRVLGFVHRARGELGSARRAYEEAVAPGENRTSVGLALVSLAEGKTEEAAADLEAALRAVPADQPVLARQLLPYTVEALIAVGRLGDAADLVENAVDLPDWDAGSAQLSHAEGLVRLAQGKAAEARDALAIAAETWDKLGNHLEGRRVSIALLEATLVAGGASAGLSLGRRLLEDRGRPLLPREREVVRRMLRRAGVRTPAVTASGSAPAGTGEKSRLTNREQAVLREVAQGRTNREIADVFGIAEKTVSVHVSNILAKLGCRTRTQAARFAPQ